MNIYWHWNKRSETMNTCIFSNGKLVLATFALSVMYLKGNCMTSFHKKDICNVREKIQNGCITPVNSSEQVRSLLECITICLNDSTCSGANQHSDGTCYILNITCNDTDCGTDTGSHQYFTKENGVNPCQNGGQWNNLIQQSSSIGVSPTCNCSETGGWVGDLCDRRPVSCHELMTFGYAETTHTVLIKHPLIADPFSCQCTIKNTVKTLLFKNSGGYDFNKTWTDYFNGFQNDSNIWIGLEKIRAFNLDGLDRMRLIVRFSNGSYHYTMYSVYEGVTVQDQGSNFALTFDSYRSWELGDWSTNVTLGNCFGPSNGSAFSTFDNDNDNDPDVNNAYIAGAGWWFPEGTFSCNPAGRWVRSHPASLSEEHIKFPGIDMSENWEYFGFVSLTFS